jgi:tetrahydromethanopterin S-methyltransferase subunit B
MKKSEKVGNELIKAIDSLEKKISELESLVEDVDHVSDPSLTLQSINQMKVDLNRFTLMVFGIFSLQKEAFQSIDEGKI